MLFSLSCYTRNTVNVNQCDFEGAADEFLVWNKVRNPKTGKLEVSKGLEKRRKREREIFVLKNN